MDAKAYTTFAEILRRAGAEVSLSESHGLLCGLLCGGVPKATDGWIGQLFSEGGPGDARDALDALREMTTAQLDGENLEFNLLLPGDEAPLAERAEALADWCQGFVYALGASGVGAGGAQLPGDAGELLNDLVQISQTGFSEDEDLEEQEGAYAELEEYVRVGVMLIREELSGDLPDDLIH